MTYDLVVDANRWRSHLADTVQAEPRTVPVIKGNGYGFGLERLATEAAALGVDTVAVGMPHEVAAVRRTFAGDVLVLSPWHPATARPGDPEPGRDGPLTTVSHPDALLELAQRSPGARVVVEVRTSMGRHGVVGSDLPLLLRPAEALNIEGFALHLPLDRRSGEDLVDEVLHWAGRLSDAPLHPRRLWVSHLTSDELARVRAFLPGADVRPRTGTRLWLGAPSAYRVAATVLDVHAVAKGERVGYRRRRAPHDGHVVVVSGGTSHGVGLEAPDPVTTLQARGKAAARGGLQAVGVAMSPFRWQGRRLRFVEPPHMQVSMLWWPTDATVPSIGDAVEAIARMTTATFDRVEGLPG